MLKLQRRVGETVVIDETITATVLKFMTNSSGEVVSVELGFNAPKEVVIDRQEVHLRKIDDQRQKETSQAG